MQLDILEAVMTTLGYSFLRMDGQTPVTERQDLIDLYNSNDQYFVFLLSTKVTKEKKIFFSKVI